MATKQSTKSSPIVFTLFPLFSLVFALFRTFSLVFALFGLSVSDRFWLSVFALFRTIRLLPFSGCHLDSPDIQKVSLESRSRSWCAVCSRVMRLIYLWDVLESPRTKPCRQPRPVSTRSTSGTSCRAQNRHKRHVRPKLCRSNAMSGCIAQKTTCGVRRNPGVPGPLLMCMDT